MQTLRFRLLLLGTIPFLLMLAAGSVVYRSTIRDLVISEWRERVSEQVAFKRMVVDDWLQQRRESLLFLAGDSAWRSADPAKFSQVATLFLEVFEDFRAVVFASPEGEVLFDSSLTSQSVPAGASVGDRLYFKRALAGRTNISDVFVSRTSGRSLVVIASPVIEDGNILGVVIAPVSINSIGRAVSALSPEAAIYTFLVNSDNRLITPASWMNPFDAIEEIPEDSVPRATGNATIYRSAADERVIGSARRLDNRDWLLIGEIPLDRVLETFSTYNTRLVVATAVALLLILAASLFLASTVEKPVEHLVKMSQLVDKREYDAALSIRRSRKAPREIQNLHGAFQDMAYRLNQFVRQLQQISITDPLTELPNRRHFEAEVRRLSNSATDGRPAGSLLLLDLDHFKRINDQRGHPAGDRVLQGFSEVMRNTLRDNDLPARIGGEEFAVLAPQTTPRDAEELAHRIRRRTKEQLGVTVSIGIAEVTPAEMHEDRTVLSAVFNAADSALYTSKRRGRNRVTVYTAEDGL